MCKTEKYIFVWKIKNIYLFHDFIFIKYMLMFSWIIVIKNINTWYTLTFFFIVLVLIIDFRLYYIYSKIPGSNK